MFTDSSKFEYGGTFNRDFIYGTFLSSCQELDIQVLEFYPIFLLVHLFANKLKSSSVLFHCDNIAVVAALNKETSLNKSIMKLLRPLVLTLLKFNISLSAEHIAGTKNIYLIVFLVLRLLLGCFKSTERTSSHCQYCYISALTIFLSRCRTFPFFL